MTRMVPVAIVLLVGTSACNSSRGATDGPAATAAEARPEPGQASPQPQKSPKNSPQKAPAPAAARSDSNQIDERARAVINEMVRAYGRLKTYSDRFEIRTVGGKPSETTTATLAFAAPAKLAVTFEEDGQKSSRVTDGLTYYVGSATFKDKYQVQAMPSPVYGSRALLQYQPAGEAFTPLLAGLDPFQEPWGHAPRSLTLAQPTVIDEVPADIVVARFEDETGNTMHETLVAYEVGQKDRLIRRIVTTTRTRGADGRLGKSTTTVETHSEIQVNPELAGSTFRFTPPAGAKAVERFGAATWDEHLRPGSVPAPLTGVDTKGNRVSLEQYKGQPTLVTFWATWCPYCRREQPYIVQAEKKYGTKGLRVLGVSLDTEVEDVGKYTAAHGMPWPQLCDGKKWQSDYARLYGVRSLPFSLLVGRDGKVAAVNPSRVQLDEVVDAALKGRATGSSSNSGDCAECGTG